MSGVTDVGPWECDALTTDGSPIHLRPIRPEDADALVAFHGRLSPDTVYFRFFSAHPRLLPQEIERFTQVDHHDRVALVAVAQERIVGVGRYDRLRPGGPEAEVAFVVDDAFQRRGLGTLLLEHLATIAAADGIERFRAEVLPANRRMLDVFGRSGFEESAHFSGDVVDVVLPVSPTRATVAAIEEREHSAEARSIQRLLSPRSVAVVGASDRPGSVGQALMTSLVGGGFAGSIHPINRRGGTIADQVAYPSVRDIPEPVDLALVAVPSPAVEDAVADCAAKGVTHVVVITAGFAETGPEGQQRQQALLDLARRHGMRLVGPNCLGIANTEVGLDATLAPFRTEPGNVAFMSQSGALGIALLERSAALGIGVSSFVSVGNKADVSGNDLLQYWEDDPRTDVILLYLESFGNPRKFARLARRVSRRKPIVALKSGRTAVGRRAASSQTAATASVVALAQFPSSVAAPARFAFGPDTAVDALFEQAGVIRVDTLTDLFDTAQLLAWQPLPAGARLGIVGNSGGPATMACDACSAHGVELADLGATTTGRIRELISLPSDVPAANPVDLLAGASAEQLEQAIRALLDEDGVDAALAVVTPVLGVSADDLAGAIARAAAQASKPVLACILAVDATPGALRDSHVPWYSSPEAAVRALARVMRYASWRDRERDPGHVPDLEGVDRTRAAAALTTTLDGLTAAEPTAWLPPADAAELLAAYGIEAVPTLPAPTADEAVAIADQGVEMVVGVVHDPAFGPLVMLGAGGVAGELLADRTYRILPLTDRDAAAMVRSLQLAPLLFGYRGRPHAAVGKLEELLLRLGRLADDFPVVAELDGNPVIVTTTGAWVADIKVRVASAAPGLPADRRMRS